ncbi:MAG: hypothetical protein MUE44_22745 [Oscillatoriaceae cyanobacterium Prado104]|nr:hypothetical protein [Oscillatoriaceae cyanobacterium Prado104]
MLGVGKGFSETGISARSPQLADRCVTVRASAIRWARPLNSYFTNYLNSGKKAVFFPIALELSIERSTYCRRNLHSAPATMQYLRAGT